jgi:hypothetical protein
MSTSYKLRDFVPLKLLRRCEERFVGAELLAVWEKSSKREGCR